MLHRCSPPTSNALSQRCTKRISEKTKPGLPTRLQRLVPKTHQKNFRENKTPGGHVELNVYKLKKKYSE